MKKLRALLVWVLTVTMFGQTVYAGTIQTQHPGRDHGQMITIYEPKMQVGASGVEIIVTVQVDSPVNLTHTVECTLVSENDSAYILFPPLFQSISINGTCAIGEFRFYLPADAVYGAFGGWLRFIDPLTGIEQLGLIFHVPASSYVRCDHKAAEKLTYDGIEYGCYVQGERGYQEKYDVVHKLMDRYRGTCSECGNVFFRYDNLRDEAHHTPACPCGYTQPGYNAIRSARLLPVGICCAGEDFQLYVNTDATVDRLTAVNNTGVALNMPWTSYENGDGTKTWTAVYTSNIAAYEGRTWTVTGYNARNQKIGEKTSEPLIIPRREEAARVTRCQQALKGYLELTNFTRKQAERYSKIVGVDYTGITLWQVITRQSLEVTGDLGATAANAVSNAYANMGEFVWNLFNQKWEKMGYTKEKIDQMVNDTWRECLFRTFGVTEEDNDSNFTGSEIVQTTKTIINPDDCKNAAVATNKIADILEQLHKGGKHAKDNPKLVQFILGGKHSKETADLIDNLRKNANKMAETGEGLSKTFDGLTEAFDVIAMLAESAEAMHEVQELQKKYQIMRRNASEYKARLWAIAEDAERAGNDALVKAAKSMISKMEQAEVDLIEAVYVFLETLANQTGAFVIGTLMGPLANAVERVTNITRVTNFDEVYDTAADLYIIYAMQQSISIPASWDECEYNFRTFQLLAQVHAAGCDAAIEFINAHSGLGAGVKELGIESQDAKEQVIELLLGEKQSFLDYAAEIERLSVNGAPSAGDGGR